MSVYEPSLSPEVRAAVEFSVDLLDAKDPYGRCHADGVTAISVLVAESMGFDAARLERLWLAAKLHDLGKLDTPEHIVIKPGRLTREEYLIVKGHSKATHDLLLRHPQWKALAEIVLHHHEYWDGTGYPAGLAGDAIPLESRIMCVADTFDAMTTDRPYRRRLGHEDAFAEINRLAGSQFCPEVVEHLNRVRPRIPDLTAAAAQVLAEHLVVERAALPRTEASTVTLDKLEPGEKAQVAHLGGDPELRRRLLELGLVPGAEVELVRVAPMGDPIEIGLRGAGFSLRKDDAQEVEVRRFQDLEAQVEAARALVRAPSGRRFQVAVAGNPNTGKTTLFNALTDASGHVGNYPGITVDRLTAELELDGMMVDLVDVPGTYSLNARSREEQVAIDEILGRAGSRRPDLVLMVLNATNLERSLYTLLQVQELGFPVLAVANMMDEARDRGIRLDLDGLGSALGVPVLPVVAREGEGLGALRETLASMLSGDHPRQTNPWSWRPSGDLREHLDELAPFADDLLGADATLFERRALALWCLMSIDEDDDLQGIPDELRAHTTRLLAEMKDEGHDLDIEVTQARYGFIDRILQENRRQERARGDVSRKIDGVLTHPIYGLAAFLLTMGIIFAALFDWAAPLMDGLEGGVGWFADLAASVLPDGLLQDMVVDGVIAGVGSVVVFLPQILILFLFITLLESSGYLARAAFMMDRLMRRLGLSGKAFVPMLSGFACAVPGIMATRTLESRRDRLITMMVLPLISCSARLPVYVLIIAALFPSEDKILGPISLGVAMMFGLYVVSTATALIAAGLLGRFVFRGETPSLLLELPPYRIPSVKQVARVLWDRGLDFLRTAGTVILVASIVLWGLLEFPKPEAYSQDFDLAITAAEELGDEDSVIELENARKAEELEASMAGRMGRLIEPVIRPLGYDWKIGVGLIGSIAAREVFVSTLGQVYSVGEADEDSDTLREAMRTQRHRDGSPVYTPLTGLSILVFFMFAIQCFATVATVKQEAGGWKWALFQVGYMTSLAYVAALLVYQVGSALGFG